MGFESNQRTPKATRNFIPMAAMIIKCFFAIIFTLCIISEGFAADCSLDNINIGTVRSGRQIQGKPEWNVTVINNCNCTQSLIKLTCQGFQTTEAIDPSILSKSGDDCLLIKGNPLNAFASVSFSYAWDPPFLLLPSQSVVSC